MGYKHRRRAKKLNRRIKYPLDLKLHHSMRIIRYAISQHKYPEVSCSFGKDSLVVGYLVRLVAPNVAFYFGNTRAGPPEQYEHRDFVINQWGIKDFHEGKAKTTYWKIKDQRGYPGMVRSKTKSHKAYCCFELKDRPFYDWLKTVDYDLIFTGVTAPENSHRRGTFIRRDWYYHWKTVADMVKRPVYKCNPIIHWTEDDIWEFTRLNNIPICKAYERMPRLGCEACTGFLSWEEVMAKANPKLYAFIINDLRKLGVTVEPRLEAFL